MEAKAEKIAFLPSQTNVPLGFKLVPLGELTRRTLPRDIVMQFTSNRLPM